MSDKPKGRAPKYTLPELLVMTAEGRKTESPLHTAVALATALKDFCEKNQLGAEGVFKFAMTPKPWEHDSFKAMCDAFNIRPVEDA